MYFDECDFDECFDHNNKNNMTKNNQSAIKQYIQTTYLTWENAWKTLNFEWNNIVFEDWRTLSVNKEWNKFFINVSQSDPIFLNNRELYWQIEIRDNDIIRLDENTSSALIRFRDKDCLKKSVYEISTDSMAIAKESNENALIVFFIHFFKQFFRHSSIFIIIIAFWIISVSAYSVINLESMVSRNVDEIEKTRQYTIKTLEKFSKNNDKNKSNINLSKSYKAVWIIWTSLILKDSNNQQVQYERLFELCNNTWATFARWNIVYDFYWTVFSYEKWKIMTNKHVIKKDLSPVISDMRMYWCNLTNESLNWIHFEISELSVWFPDIKNSFWIKNIKTHPKYDIAIAELEWNNIDKIETLNLENNDQWIDTWDQIINIWYPAWTDLILARATETFEKYNEEYNNIVNTYNSPQEVSIIAEKWYVLPNISQWIIWIKTDYIIAFDGTNVWWNSWWPLIDKNWNVIWIAMSKFGEHETLSSWLPIKLVISELNNIR